ncbi:hypothetical protein DCAR_0312261 [Daucus carota subsp. sativus]|uniref:Ubiquitin-like protease family profile domain-containing protein n=1 Tax=Daucus carota subsp. sativus TaxID=79200 RepID=A0AAF0WNP3_DAUCS|nr:hypothetical protein DCAR_0312261 [Daucus carota subsp. sativus]
MIFHLKDEQRKWVHRSGFGLLLNFELEMLPAKLAYNVLQIFDHNSVSLKLKSLDIQITKDDVFDVLGLPYGGLKIQLADETKFKQREECWNAQFSTEKKEREQITAQMLVQKMRKQGVSDNFKLNFLIVMSNALIGTTSSSYVDKQLLRIDDDLDHLQRYNWSEYLLHYLVIATEAWNRTASTFFRGSLVFLTNLESNQDTDIAKSSTKLPVAKNNQDVIPSFSLGIEELDDLRNATVFFPITKSEHFYLICYDIRNQGHFIIDNIKREGNPKQYYMRVPDILHSHFCNYIQIKGNIPLSRRIRRFKRTYLTMPWQTSWNSTDCGIFVMRHMETFKGDPKKWDSGLAEEGVSDLNNYLAYCNIHPHVPVF